MAISSADLLSPDANTLYKRFGFRNKDNNTGAMFNNLGLSSYERAGMGAGLATELEPERQGAIRALVASNNPANMVANARAQGGQLFNQGSEMGGRAASLLAQRGAGAGAQFGAIAQGQNQGIQAANQLQRDAYSPEAQQGALAAILSAISQAPGSGLQELLAMSGVVSQKEHDRMAREQSQGLGGLAPLLGAIGQFAGGGIPGLGGGGGAMKNPFAAPGKAAAWTGNLGAFF